MDKDIREAIALMRYQIISPVPAEPKRAQNQYFRSQALIEHPFPHYGTRRVGVSTMKAWLRAYRNKGFDALKPKERADVGRPRRLSEETLRAVEIKAKAYPHWSGRMLYENLKAQGLLGIPPVHYNTLRRLIKEHGWSSKRIDVRKAFEMDNVNELWLCDFMHGPQVTTSSKAILCAVIDDHSRMVVGSCFNASETISSLTLVLKDAFLTYGIPKRLYVDNGAAFASELLARSCAIAGISLIHSKPYDSPSRGKIERFFRTVRERFLSRITSTPTITELNDSFRLWLQDDYHHKLHSGIGEKPIDRYNASISHIPIRRLSKAELDEIFLLRFERIVNNDATITFKGSIYEVPAAYIGHRVEIRHPVDDPQHLFLYNNDIRVGRIRLVDKKENARVFRPKNITNTISFHQGRTIP